MITQLDCLECQWRKFHREHPEIWVLIQQFALEKAAIGYANYSINGVFERVRWETHVAGGAEYKMPNNHRPFYARLFNKEVIPKFFIVHHQPSGADIITQCECLEQEANNLWGEA